MSTDLRRTSRVPEPTVFPEGPERNYLQQVVRVLRGNFQNLENLIDKAMELLASNVFYSNFTSGLTATNVQDAIDELSSISGGIPAAIGVSYSNTTSGLTATNVQAALDEIDAELDTFGVPSDYATAAQGALADTSLQPGDVFVHQYTVLQDVKSSGVGGGSFTSGSFVTRVLNTVQIDQIGITLSSNQFILPAGTYVINASAPAVAVNFHKTALYNVTDAAYTFYGTSEYTSSSSSYATTRSHCNGVFTIAGTKTFELRHRCSTTNAGTGALGNPNSFGVSEIYAEVQLCRIA